MDQSSQRHYEGVLIQRLLDCATSCKRCAASTVEKPGITSMDYCVKIIRDCAELCFATAKLLTRNSELGHELLPLCHKICLQSAEECRKQEHAHCKECEEECTQCAEECHAHLDASLHQMAMM